MFEAISCPLKLWEGFEEDFFKELRVEFVIFATKQMIPDLSLVTKTFASNGKF